MPVTISCTELGRRLQRIQVHGRYTGKDLAKARRATQMIGQGTPGSSTEAYRIAAGDLANTGRYGASEAVFVSSNGQRPGRFNPIDASGSLRGAYRNLELAVKAGATILTDRSADRLRVYNVGERQVAAWLEQSGYVEVSSGVWRPLGF